MVLNFPLNGQVNKEFISVFSIYLLFFLAPEGLERNQFSTKSDVWR
jgi:hypothetical protein